MSACIACRAAPQPRASLSYKATTVIAVITAMTFAASGAAPTTLYQRYQEVFGLTPFVLTVIFGAYVLSLLGRNAWRRDHGHRPQPRAVLNSITAFIGLTAGSLGGGRRWPRRS